MMYLNELIWGRKKKRKKRGTIRGPGKRGKKKTKRKPVPQQLRREIRRRSRGRCEFCGISFSANDIFRTRELGPKLHHIDGNPANNKMNNLILLCANHHDMAGSGEISKGELRNCISRSRFWL